MATTIYVYASAKDAVLHSCQHGWHRVDVETSTWQPEERELLAASVRERDGARYCDATQYEPATSVAPPTAEGLRAHVAARLAAVRQRAAEAEAEAEADVEAVKAECQRLRATLLATDHVRADGRFERHSLATVCGHSCSRASAAAERAGIPYDGGSVTPFVTAEHLEISAALELAAERKAAAAAEAEVRAAEAEARRQAAVVEAEAAEAERVAWIEAHGSERLRECVAEGYNHELLYRSERLAAERPGWRRSVGKLVNADKVSVHIAPEAPPLDAIRAARAWRQIVPDVALCEVDRWRHDPEDEDADEEGDVVLASQLALRCQHLGIRLYRLPEPPPDGKEDATS